MRGVVAFLGALAVAACMGDPPPLTATDVRVTRTMPGASMAAGYLTLANNTSQSITITRVTSAAFESVELHESVVEDGVARMHALGDVTLRPGATVRFEPGGKHLMLMRPIDGGGAVTLNFYAGRALVLTVRAE